MPEVRYPMKLVVHRTGLSAHVLRVWERRYGAVTPFRSDSNQRLYTEEETARLETLARLTRAGHGIRQIAILPLAELQSMLEDLPEESETASLVEAADDPLETAWQCVVALDPNGLRKVLDRAAVALGVSGLMTDLLIPLIHQIGNGWENGELSIAEEHAASAVIREALFLSSEPFAETTGAPLLVLTTPTGQLHELGALLVSAIARQQGWDVIYLGPSLPSAEIARAVLSTEPTALALSIVYPGDDPQLPEELRRLKRLLPPDIPILIGGRASASYARCLEGIGALMPPDLAAFKAELTTIRRTRADALR